MMRRIVSANQSLFSAFGPANQAVVSGGSWSWVTRNGEQAGCPRGAVAGSLRRQFANVAGPRFPGMGIGARRVLKDGNRGAGNAVMRRGLLLLEAVDHGVEAGG